MKASIALYFFAIFSFFSCVKDIDFDQADDLELTPTYVASLIFTELDQTSFVTPGGTEITQFRDVTNIEFFNESVSDELEKLVLDFEITNPFDRRFTLDFRFLNDTDTEVYRIPRILINENVTKLQVQEEIVLATNRSILNATKIEITLELLPSSDGSVIDFNEKKTFIFKSAGTFYFRINNI